MYCGNSRELDTKAMTEIQYKVQVCKTHCRSEQKQQAKIEGARKGGCYKRITCWEVD